MATCKNCNATIPDSEEYCENCLKEMDGKVSESYLDDLLNQVMSSEEKQTTPNKRSFTKHNVNKETHEDKTDTVVQEDLLESIEEPSNDSFVNGESNHETENNLADDLDISLLKDSQNVSFEEMQELAENYSSNESLESDQEHPSGDSLIETEIPSEEENVDSQGDDLDSLLGDLLQSMDENEKNNDTVNDSEMFDHKSDEDDIMELLSSMENSDDIFAIDEYMSDQDYPADEGSQSSLSTSADENNISMEDINADAENEFTDISGDEIHFADADIDEELLKLIPEVETEEIPTTELHEKTGKKEEAEKKKKTAKDKKEKEAESRGFFGKVFGNVKEVRTEEEIEELKEQAIRSINDKEQKEEEEKAKKAQKKEEKKKKQEEAAAAKKAKKAEAAKKSSEKKAEKERRKKEAKTKKELEIQNLIDEIDENEGRINRIGATIIFSMFAIFAAFVVIGTNLYSYSLNIKNASYNFGLQRYNEAYKNVYGMEIKDEDIELYDKIMTVMYVNKQLNSYNNYSAMNKYPEALDSLLKGLERYDKYLSLATTLGIKTDLDGVREKILKELDKVYQLSEKEAVKLIGIEDQAEYSIEVYNVVLERMETTLTKEEQ